jgi:DNA (cytosine-5)-methyltransferase 1
VNKRPIHVDLFSGIGGFSLAAQWAGFTTALHCEIDPYCRKVLEKHWRDVPIHGDIHTLTGEIVRAHLARDSTADVQYASSELVRGTRDGEARDMGEASASSRSGGEGALCRSAPRTSVDLLTGGFPCQPFSIAGQQRGTADDRHLWPEMSRLIAELRPTWICGENVSGFIAMALDDVCLDLEAAGYEVWPVVFPACGVGAWHKRERVFIVAHDTHADQQGSQGYGCVSGERDGAGEQPVGTACTDVPDAESAKREQSGPAWTGRDGLADGDHPWLGWDGRQPLAAIWEREPVGSVGVMADGISPRLVGRLATGEKNRVNKLRALGNAVVPQQAYMVLAAIYEALHE